MKKTIICIITAVMLFTFTADAEEVSPWAKAELNENCINIAQNYVKDKSFTANITKAEVSRLLLCACLKEGISFNVIKTNPYADLNDPVVLVADGLGLTEGNENGFFPGKEVTRLEAAKYMYNLAELIYGFDEEDRELFHQRGIAANSFEDYAPNEETAEIVGFALDWEILRGKTPNLLALDEPCSVEQALVMISRCLG